MSLPFKASSDAHLLALPMQGTQVVSQENKQIQAASFTQVRTHACVLARQLQDSQRDIQELILEVVNWQKLATEAALHLQQRDAEVQSFCILCLAV